MGTYHAITKRFLKNVLLASTLIGILCFSFAETTLGHFTAITTKNIILVKT